MPKRGNKDQIAIGLTPLGREMLDALSEYEGLSKSAVMERAIRKMFRESGLELEKQAS